MLSWGYVDDDDYNVSGTFVISRKKPQAQNQKTTWHYSMKALFRLVPSISSIRQVEIVTEKYQDTHTKLKKKIQEKHVSF